MLSIRLLPLALLLGLVPQAARADVPPDPSYVEKCTIAKVCAVSEDGDACYVYDYNKPLICKQKHAKDGFVYKCQAGGGHSYTEVYCRPKAAKRVAAAPIISL